MNLLNLSRAAAPAVVVGAAVLALSAATCGAAAAGELDVKSYHITFLTRDAETPTGAQRLMRRIEIAADEVCGDEHTRDLAQREDIRRCRAGAIERAVRDANVPTLTALVQRPDAPLTMAGR